MKFNLTHSFLFLISILLFTSCDPTMNLNLTVKNNTEEVIIVEFKALHNHNKDTSITLVANKEATILKISLREKAKNYDCCPCEIGALNIFTVDSSATVTKDYLNKDNWIKIKDNKREVKCIFEIIDSDLN
jgi:hypothetical protein